MIDALMHINIAQTIYTIIIVLTKRPLNTIDKVLSVWLFFLLAFCLISLSRTVFPNTLIDSWVYNAIIMMTFPSFLYLYIKYLTLGDEKLKLQDLKHFIVFGAFLVSISILIFVYPEFTNTSDFLLSLKIFPIVLGTSIIFSFITYGVYTIKLVNQFDKERDEYFSYHTHKVSIDGIRNLVYVFYIYFSLTIIAGIIQDVTPLTIEFRLILHGAFTVFLYSLSFFGYKQTKLKQFPKEQKEANTPYQKSGLKPSDAEIYEGAILSLMEKERPWLNPEISVIDISAQLNIPQYYITQVLNEGLKKNFYTLINEYRTNEVIRLFGTEKCKNWSLTSIAFEAGFNSKSTFNSFFKKHTGITPSEYRKEIEFKSVRL